MTKLLLKKQLIIPNLSYQKKGRDKDWMFNQQRVSTHQLEAYLVYYLWKDKDK